MVPYVRHLNMLIPSDPYKMQERINHIIRTTLQMISAILIGMEVAIPPNPYKTHLIAVLSLLIVHKYHIPSRMIDAWEKLWHSRS